MIAAHPDHLGSSMVLTNEQGAVIGEFRFRPFGGFAGPTGSTGSTGFTDGAAIHHYFTGQELDQSTDLYHLGARYYDSALGRFLQTDPLLDGDPQNSPYTYARNNPLRLIDPTGLSAQQVWDTLSRGTTATLAGTLDWLFNPLGNSGDRIQQLFLTTSFPHHLTHADPS